MALANHTKWLFPHEDGRLNNFPYATKFRKPQMFHVKIHAFSGKIIPIGVFPPVIFEKSSRYSQQAGTATTSRDHPETMVLSWMG